MSFESLELLGGVLFSGILTSISPCPLVTNIAAISLLTRQFGDQKGALLAGGFYALGRMTAYFFLAFLILKGIVGSGENLTRWLGASVHQVLGPILILLGMVLTGLLTFSSFGISRNQSFSWTSRLGIWSAFPLGILFALAFCPTSAVAFLMMIGLSAQSGKIVLFPLCFGLTTAFPVLVFSWIIAFQSSSLNKVFQITAKVERFVRLGGGVLFILAGIYLTLIYIWKV